MTATKNDLTPTASRVAVIGAGSWGTALAHHLGCLGHDVRLWVFEAELLEIGRHISYTEVQAADAEQELKTVLILQMLSGKIGDEMDCVVSGLTNFGVFVQCVKFGIEGLIEPGDLGLDEWRYNEKAQAVIGRHSGKSIHLGQPIRVRIVTVHVAGRQLFLAPAEPLIEEPRGRRFRPEKFLKKQAKKRR